LRGTSFFLVINLAGPHASTLPVYIAGFMTSEGLFWAKMSAAATHFARLHRRVGRSARTRTRLDDGRREVKEMQHGQN
jgi:hypothetical protein